MLNLSMLDNDVYSVQTLPCSPDIVRHSMLNIVWKACCTLGSVYWTWFANLILYKPKLSRYKVKLVIPAIQATPSYLKWQTWPRSVLPSKKCPVIGGDCKMQIIISLQMINSRPALHWKRVSLGLEISEVLLGQRIRKAELQFKRLLETLSEIWPLT